MTGFLLGFCLSTFAFCPLSFDFPWEKSLRELCHGQLACPCSTSEENQHWRTSRQWHPAGIFALGQDLEEWWHVERFAYPVAMPVFVIAPPGRSHWRAGDLAATARALGRRVIAVTHKDDTAVTRHAHAVLPVHGAVREEFSPVLYHLFANYVASYVAARLGRALFQSDRPELLQSVNEYYASLNKRKDSQPSSRKLR